MKENTITLSIKDLALLKSNPLEYFKKQSKETKSYSHKPHLASLPYDHSRGRTLEQLTERYNAINVRVKKLATERDKLIDKHRKDLSDYKDIWRQRDNLIKQLDELKNKEDYDQEESNNLKRDIDSLQKKMDGYNEGFKKYRKELKKMDTIFHDYFEDQNKIKWTAFKNGLLDLSPEDTARAEEYIKKHGL